MKNNLLTKIIKKDCERPRLKKGFLGPKTIVLQKIHYNIVIYWFTIKINELRGIKVNEYNKSKIKNNWRSLSAVKQMSVNLCNGRDIMKFEFSGKPLYTYDGKQF